MEEDSSIETFEHEATVQTPALTDYRYVGANPNNYVYFGCEDDCTEDNLYRIIGIIPTQSESSGEYENRVKIIKLKSIGKYTWHSSGNNRWDVSNPKTAVVNYYNTLGDYQNYIETIKHYLGGYSYSLNNGYLTPNQHYIQERSNTPVSSGGSVFTIEKVILPYASDFGFSIGGSYRNGTTLSNQDVYKTNSWMVATNRNAKLLNGLNTNDKYGSYVSIFLDYWSASYTSTSHEVFPSFYLKTDVVITDGNGSQKEPFRISANE